MSHTIAEKQKRVGSKTYHLDIWHSGGRTVAKITCYNSKTHRWGTILHEEGSDAEERAYFTWKRL